MAIAVSVPTSPFLKKILWHTLKTLFTRKRGLAHSTFYMKINNVFHLSFIWHETNGKVFRPWGWVFRTGPFFLWGPFFFRFKVRIWFLDDVQFVALVTISEGPTYKGSKISNFNGWEVTSARFWILSGFFFLTLWTALTQSLLVSISVVLMYISSTNVASLKIC